MNNTQNIALKIGGSLLAPNQDGGMDWDYLYALRKVVTELVEQGWRIGISTGGGKLSRRYVTKLRELETSVESQHKVGVAATNVHIHVLASVFEDKLLCPPIVYATHDKALDGDSDIPEQPGVILMGASKPGYSNDWNAVQMAILMKTSVVISAKNVDGVYTADPKIDKTATRIDTLSWDKYFEIIGGREKHDPGGSYPVGPYAARLAESEKIDFLILGKDLKNLRAAAAGSDFVGSRIASL